MPLIIKNKKSCPFGQLFLYKSLGIAASFTKFFGGLAAFKTFHDVFGSFGTEDGFNILTENVAEGYCSVAVKAAGNNGSVRKNSELVFKTVAAEPGSFNFRFAVGPFKTVAPFKKNFVPEFNSVGGFAPFAGNVFFKKGKSVFVFAVIKTFVPKAEINNDSGFCGFF